MRKKIMSGLLVGALALSLTACGGSSENSGSGSGNGSSGGGTLKVAIWDNNQLKGLQEIAEEWSRTSGVKVDFQVLDWGNYWTLLEAGVSGGDMPDVMWMHSAYAEMYQNAGVLLGLNDYIEKDDAIDLKNYYPGITELYASNGEQYAIPKDHDTIAVVYNKKVFDQYGISYPQSDWTWEDFSEIAKQITIKGKSDGVYGTYMNCGSNQSGWYNLIYDFGGKIISEDKKSSGMDDEKTIAAMNFVGEHILPYCPSQDSMANTAGDAMLVSGKIGMYLDGSWMVNTYYTSDNSKDLAWVELPYEDVNGNGTADKEERCSIYNGLGWAIQKKTENPDAAFSLVSALTSKEGQLKQSELGVTMAAYEGCSDAFTSAFEGMDLAAFTDIEKNGTLIFRPYSKYTGRWEDNFTKGLIDAWNDPSKMTEACKKLAKEMNEILAEEE